MKQFDLLMSTGEWVTIKTDVLGIRSHKDSFLTPALDSQGEPIWVNWDQVVAARENKGRITYAIRA